jgi:hypothetical protein
VFFRCHFFVLVHCGLLSNGPERRRLLFFFDNGWLLLSLPMRACWHSLFAVYQRGVTSQRRLAGGKPQVLDPAK